MAEQRKLQVTQIPDPQKSHRIHFFASVLIALLVQFDFKPALTAPLILQAPREASTKQKVTPKDILTGNTLKQKEFLLRKHDFVDKAASVTSTLSDPRGLSFKMRPGLNLDLYLNPEDLQRVPRVGADPIGEEIRQRFSDIPPTVSLNDFIENLANNIKASVKKATVSELPIPTDLEIDILKILWVNTVATPSDIYAELDTTWLITSEDLNQFLENMADRGFLERKKISPSNEFTLFGIVKFEKSSQNRKNKVFLYWPVLQKEKLIRYVDARRYMAFASASNGTLNESGTGYYRVLQDKLYRLVKTD